MRHQMKGVPAAGNLGDRPSEAEAHDRGFSDQS